MYEYGYTWELFRKLENELIGCFDYVPLQPDHYTVWSPKFGELLLKIGTSIDTFFRNMLGSQFLNDIEKIKELRSKGKKNLDMADYSEAFEPVYKLSEIKIEIREGSFVPEIAYRPFKDITNNDGLDWWQAYNHVKHDWFINLREANLGNVTHALSALFALNVIHIDSKSFLLLNTNVIKYEITDTDDFNWLMSRPIASSRRNELHDALTKSFLGYAASAGLPISKCKANSVLFAHVYRRDDTA